MGSSTDKSALPRVLVVDDSGVLVALTARRLEDLGYEPLTAVDGQTALELVRNGRPDIVLLDIQMPGMDGLECLRRIRAMDEGVGLPVIMLTASEKTETVVQALDEGADDYVTKPYDVRVLHARIRSQLERRTAQLAVSKSEQRYALAAAGSNDGLWDWDLQTNELFVSDHWRRHLGHEQLPGDNRFWGQLAHPDDRERVVTGITTHIFSAKAERLGIEYRMLRGDGDYAWIQLRGAAVRDAGGRATRMAGSLTDVSSPPLHDTVTGLPNQHLFADRLGTAIQNLGRIDGLRVAVLLLALDRMPLVIESLGARAAETLVRRIAQRFGTAIHPNPQQGHGLAAGTLARMSRSEFAILCQGVGDETDAARIAERLLGELDAPVVIEGQQVRTGASVGIAVTKDPNTAAETLLRQAQTALQRAREAVGSARVLYDPAMHQAANHRLRLEADLARAVREGTLQVHYQPVIELRTGRVVMAEALVRWHHEVHGPIGPDRFIPVAEQIGLIHELGRRVMHQACTRAQAWTEQGLDPVRVAVNVSPIQFRDDNFVTMVATILASSGLPAERLELELTEGVLVDDPERVGSILDAVRERGVRVALDDFGTGHSSLRYLQRFRVDTLKIDRAFVQGLPDNPDSSAIARTILAMAHELGMTVVAEGIETPEQAAFLQRHGCRLGQGFLYSKAVPAAELAAFASLRNVEFGAERVSSFGPQEK